MSQFRTSLLACAAMLCGLAGFTVAHALPQDGERPESPGIPFKPPTRQEMQAGMQKWQKANTPGEHHRKLAYFLGDWITTMRMWMGGAGSGTPMQSRGTANYRWLAKNRWLMEENRGAMMGMPVTSWNIMGYDNYQKQYVFTHIDSFTTAMLHNAGNWGKDGKVLLTYGHMDEPMDDTRKVVKYILRIRGPDEFVAEIHDTAIGETGTKVVEWTYQRKKQ